MTVQDLPGLTPLTAADLAALGLAAAPSADPSPERPGAHRRLRVVREPADAQHARADTPRGVGEPPGAPLVGYLVLVPQGTDPAQLLAGLGTGVVVANPSTTQQTGDIGASMPAPQRSTAVGGVSESPSAPGTQATETQWSTDLPEKHSEPNTPAAQAGSGPIEVDPERHLARVEGRVLELTYLEFELLAHLVAHPGRVHSREQLVGSVWGYGHVGDGRTVDVHVARLRRKLGSAHRGRIVTVRRVGYQYLPEGQAATRTAGSTRASE